MRKPRFQIEIDEELKRAIQRKAFDQRKSVTQVLVGLLTKWLKKG